MSGRGLVRGAAVGAIAGDAGKGAAAGAAIGGLFDLSGFQFNQLSGQHYGRVIGQVRRNFWDAGFAEVFIGTSLEYGNVWESRNDIDVGDGLFAGSLYLGANTMIGPLFLGYGVAEGGANSFYLYVGALRNSPALQ